MRPTLLVLLGLSLLAVPQHVRAQAVAGEAYTTLEADAPRPGPPPPLPDLSDPNGRAGEALNEPGERSGIPKTLRSSGSKAGGPANDLNPSGQAEAPAPPKGDLDKVAAGQDLFHGNYCGKGQRGAGLPPVDALDAACMRHDACYDAAGYSSCACDATLRREAGAVSDAPDAALETRRRALSRRPASGFSPALPRVWRSDCGETGRTRLPLRGEALEVGVVQMALGRSILHHPHS